MHSASEALDTATPRWFAAHELRTPLQAIRGGVELLLEARGAGLSPDLLAAVGLIAEASIELARQLDLMAEIEAVSAAAPAAVERHCLGTLLGRPEIDGVLVLDPALAALAPTLHVLVAPAALERALVTLARAVASGPARLGCAIAEVDALTVRLELAVGCSGSGDGSVARRLAGVLFGAAGGKLELGRGGSLGLALHRG